MIEHILVASLVCNPGSLGRTIVYPAATSDSVSSKFIPGSEALYNSVLRTDAIAACATADACIQRMVIPRLSMYGGERNVSLGNLYAKDMEFFRPSSTNYGVYGKAWFQGFSMYGDTNLNYFALASNRVFKSRIGARLRDYVDDFVLRGTNSISGRIQLDEGNGHHWIDPTTNHASLVRSEWKTDDMLDTADWSRFLRGLSEFDPAGTDSDGCFAPPLDPYVPLDPRWDIPGLDDYMREGGFPVVSRGKVPSLLDLVYSRCHVRTNGIASASGRLSYDRMAMANGIVSLCDTSLHVGRVAPFYSRDDEGRYSVQTDSSTPGYTFLQKAYTLRRSAVVTRKISESAELLIGNVPGSDNPTLWQFIQYFPRDSDFEGESSMTQRCDVVAVVTNFVSTYGMVNAWADVMPVYGVTIRAVRPIRFKEFSGSVDGLNADKTYNLFAQMVQSPTVDQNPDPNVVRTLDVELWTGRMTSDGYPVPEVRIGVMHLGQGDCRTGWKGEVSFFYNTETRGVETVEKRPFIGPTYINTPDNQASNSWQYSVNPYLPKEDVFRLVERADGYSFQTLAVNTNHKDIAAMAGGNSFTWGCAKDDKDLLGNITRNKDTWAFFRLVHTSLGAVNGDGLTSFLTDEIYANIPGMLSKAYELAPHADLKAPTFAAASQFAVGDIDNKFFCPVMIEPGLKADPTGYRLRVVEDSEGNLSAWLENAAGHSLPSDTVICAASLSFGTTLSNCPGFRSVAAFCHERPGFTLKWNFPAMRFSGEK